MNCLYFWFHILEEDPLGHDTVEWYCSLDNKPIHKCTCKKCDKCVLAEIHGATSFLGEFMPVWQKDRENESI